MNTTIDPGGSQGYYRDGNRWIFSDGTILPVISGGDGDDGDTGTQPEVEQQNADPFEGLSGAGRSYLENLAEDQRDVVIPHVKNWDRHVNDWMARTKSEFQQQIAPYQQLGDVNYAARSVQLSQWLERDPASFVKALQDAGLYKPEASQGAATQQQEIPEELAPILKQYDEKLSKLGQIEQTLPQIAQWVQQQQAQQAQQEQERQIQQTLNELKGKSRYWNENGVLSLLASGAFKNGEDAVKAWDQLVQDQINAGSKASGQAPPVLGTQGSLPSRQEPVTKMSSKQTVDYVAEMLARNLGS